MIEVIMFLISSTLLGVGLAMDAFSVSMANAMQNSRMKRGEMIRIAGAFAFFQFLMPVIGWVCVHTILTCFTSFRVLIPWIALILLSCIGGKMLIEGIRDHRNSQSSEADSRGSTEGPAPVLSWHTLVLQAVATSIDALSVGFAIAEYTAPRALLAGLIIAAVTFFICIGGLQIGRRAGAVLGWRASILGGVILIAIGLEIWISNLFF